MSLQEAEGMHRGKATWGHTAVSCTHSLTRTLTHPCTQACISLRLFVQWFHKGGWWLGHVTQDPALSLLAVAVAAMAVQGPLCPAGPPAAACHPSSSDGSPGYGSHLA